MARMMHSMGNTIATRKVAHRRVLLHSLMAISLVGSSACTRTLQGTETTVPGAPVPSVGAEAPNAVGAASGNGAVESFLKAAKGQDLQAMSAIWGTVKGPARDQMKRDELEKRLIIMQCTLTHDKWVYLEDRPRLQTGGRQEFQVELSLGQRSAKTSVTTVAGPGGRWFLEDINLLPLKEFCR